MIISETHSEGSVGTRARVFIDGVPETPSPRSELSQTDEITKSSPLILGNEMNRRGKEDVLVRTGSRLSASTLSPVERRGRPRNPGVCHGPEGRPKVSRASSDARRQSWMEETQSSAARRLPPRAMSSSDRGDHRPSDLPLYPVARPGSALSRGGSNTALAQAGSPNYGRLLNFSVEQQRDQTRRERFLNAPPYPPKEKPNYTIPSSDPALMKLATPKMYAAKNEGQPTRMEARPTRVMKTQAVPPRRAAAPVERVVSPSLHLERTHSLPVDTRIAPPEPSRAFRSSFVGVAEAVPGARTATRSSYYGGTTVISQERHGKVGHAAHAAAAGERSDLSWVSVLPIPPRASSLKPPKARSHSSTFPSNAVTTAAPATRAATNGVHPTQPPLRRFSSAHAFTTQEKAHGMQRVQSKVLMDALKPPLVVRAHRCTSPHSDENPAGAPSLPSPSSAPAVYASKRKLSAALPAESMSPTLPDTADVCAAVAGQVGAEPRDLVAETSQREHLRFAVPQVLQIRKVRLTGM